MVTINSKQKIDVIIPCLKNNMKNIFECYCDKNCLKEII